MTSLMKLLVAIAVLISTSAAIVIDPCELVECEPCVQPCECEGSQTSLQKSVNASAQSEDFAVNASEKAIDASEKTKTIMKLTNDFCSHLSEELIVKFKSVNKLRKVMKEIEKVIKMNKKRPICKPSIAKALAFLRQSSLDLTASMNKVKAFSTALTELQSFITAANTATVKAFTATLVAAKASANASATALATASLLIVADCDNATITGEYFAEAAVEAEAEVKIQYDRAADASHSVTGQFTSFYDSSLELRQKLKVKFIEQPEPKELEILDALGQKCDKIFQ